jgi:hypothetical protein
MHTFLTSALTVESGQLPHPGRFTPGIDRYSQAFASYTYATHSIEHEFKSLRPPTAFEHKDFHENSYEYHVTQRWYIH